MSVVEGRQLDRQRGESVTAAIQNQPGVNMIGEGVRRSSSRSFADLNSQDIVVVEDGVRSEAEQWGNEHAPEIDPLGADRIEVMRGPNSLLYGSDALGGVISISHPELPNAHLGDGPLLRAVYDDGEFQEQFRRGKLRSLRRFRRLGLPGNVSQLQAGNFRTPQDGEVPNTGLQK